MESLKIGDRVLITSDTNSLNPFMEQYAGEEATVVYVCAGVEDGQLVNLDIDDSKWVWSYEDKLNHLTKI